jgi:hypothetical protein
VIALGLEPEPLAFRVRPLADECFDSWIDRVTRAHETTRAALFRHVGIEPALAGYDLARGARGLDVAWHSAFANLVERLAWAVQCQNDRISATFLACQAHDVLPRRIRRYACARCWYEAGRAGKPMIVRREWILRASWRCHDHELPLTDMASLLRDVASPISQADLGLATIVAERRRWAYRVRPGALRRNAAELAYLAGSRDGHGMAPPNKRYHARFAANLFHFSADRIGMLALAHGNRHALARRFERLVAARLPECPTVGGGVQAPVKMPYRLRACAPPKSASAWMAPEFLDLLRAYAWVRERRDIDEARAAVFERHFGGLLGLPAAAILSSGNASRAWPPG